MFFPEDMNFEYFFFSTYPGYFLQVLPIALIAAFLDWKRHKKTAMPNSKRFWGAVFVCYVTGLLCLVLALDMVGDLWFILLYRDLSCISTRFFVLDFDFELHFLARMTSENLFNLLMFLPFGVLYPLSRQKTAWGKTLLAGLVLVAGIELFQPIFGRAFDVNDVVLNMLGVGLSTTLFFLFLSLATRAKRKETA